MMTKTTTALKTTNDLLKRDGLKACANGHRVSLSHRGNVCPLCAKRDYAYNRDGRRVRVTVPE